MAEALTKKFEIPAFKHEADEAQWWFDNRERLAEQFELAAAEGRLGRGAALRSGSAPLLPLDPTDTLKARS